MIDVSAPIWWVRGSVWCSAGALIVGLETLGAIRTTTVHYYSQYII
jgi:hypothetical protein